MVSFFSCLVSQKVTNKDISFAPPIFFFVYGGEGVVGWGDGIVEGYVPTPITINTVYFKIPYFRKISSMEIKTESQNLRSNNTRSKYL